MAKILVIDDEESIRNMLKMVLEADGYVVFTAEDGPHGLEVFKKHSPEIVLLDVRMPGMDGVEVLRRIRAVEPDAEVIIVTGHGDMEMAVECLRKDASNFLTKPVSDEVLTHALKRSLERLAMKQKIKAYTTNLETLVREANVELEKAYRFRENLIENSPDAIVSVRKGGEILIFNSAAERLLGYTKREIVGKMNIVDLYVPGEAKEVMKDLRSDDFGDRGIVQKREMHLLDKDGNQIPVNLSAAILYEGGREAGSVGIFTDLRKTKELERQLRSELEFRENLIESSPDAIISVRNDGEIALWNSAAERLLGYKKEDVIGKVKIASLYRPEEAKRIMEDMRSNNYGGPGLIQKREMTVLDKWGNEIPVYLSAAILYQDGEEAGSVGFLTDLRERKVLEKQLVNTLLLRDNLIENSPSATIFIRKGGMISIFNSAAEKLLGYKKEEVIGKMSVEAFYPREVAKQVMKELRSDEYGGPGILERREMSLKDKFGNEIPVYLYAAIVYEDGKEAGSVGIVTDQRERKELERALMRSEKLSSLGKLSAGIAHEINQPLTGVLTFASLLQKKYKDDDPTRKDLEIIVRETKRILGIVQRVLDFARETPLKKKALQIQQIVDQTLGIVEHQECFFGVTIKKEYDLKVPEVVIDPSQMEQVFLNIILNAADAMNGSGTLTVRTRADQKWVMVDLEDTGRGMPEEIIDKIFDPFFTTKDSTEGSGMGLGLALSYGIVKNHDGDIRVKSKVGKGTTFTITLPLTKPGEKKPAAP